MKPDFSKCKRLANELLLCQPDFLEFKINVRTLKFSQNIVFETFQRYCHITGTDKKVFFQTESCFIRDCLTIKFNHTNLILYDANQIKQKRLNWSFAHEVGHIYLNHQKDTKIEEIEANFFASHLLMPDAVLYCIKENKKSFTAVNIKNMFFVSPLAAEKKLKTLKSHNLVPQKMDYDLLEKFASPIADFFSEEYYLQNGKIQLK
ncbi:MAG: ImmA/IrrE family metallo-endopeptidase [Anaerotignaceae bacterium]